MTAILARRRAVLGLVPVALTVALIAGSCTYQTRDLRVSLPTTAQSSFIYDADGRLITTFRGEQHRRNLETIDEVPRILQDAVVAIEDERFWQHQGVDVRALLRAARSNISVDGVLQGGSTITQQYVGRAFLDRTEITVSRKIEEIALALQLERAYSKEFILLQYLNTVNFGEGAYGVLTAAREYFDKDLDELTLAEAALLAGLIQAPSARNPYENRESAIRRREAVLERMLANDWISEREFRQARTEPLRLAPRVATLEEEYEYGYFVEEVRQWILTDPRFGATPDDRVRLLFEGGLHIHTTLRPDVQHAAESALTAILPWEGGPSAAIVVIRNDTGHVEAMVGGRDFFGDSASARFNLATQGGRQAGSGFKPFVLAAALEQGIQISALYPAPSEIELPIPGLEETWEVSNFSETGAGGLMTLREALVRSINTVYAQLMEDVTPDAGVAMAQRLGVASPLQPVLAAVLGSEDVTVLDMAAAYSTFARRGIYIPPTMVTRVTHLDGTLLYEHEPNSTRVLNSRIADEMTDVMTEVVHTGTGRRAAVEGRQVAGKTGTAENFVDAGFTGYTPQYTTAVWVGFPDAQIPMEPPTTERDVTGGSYPAEIFALVMAAVHEGLRAESFPASVPTTTTTQYPQVVEVPSVIDLPLEEATDAIEEAYLDVRLSEVVRDDVEPGTVVNQIPRATELASGGSAVIIEVAVEPPEPDPADLEAVELPGETGGDPDAQDGEGLELEGFDSEGLEAEGGGGQPGGGGGGEAGGGQ
ncbi:MAG: PASTA domain-containing protein [Acidimicrobiia bacterium]|nr:PASTA domain-containing protein [Acidimicrobiia bacterium]MYC46391.1 PASTA domain-containing protein [Acidimicrobiia bacterium]